MKFFRCRTGYGIKAPMHAEKNAKFIRLTKAAAGFAVL